jgi:hypothetical protein
MGDGQLAPIPWSAIDDAIASYDGKKLVGLVGVATDSPGCLHRLTSLSLVWLRAIRHPPAGTRIPNAADLTVIVRRLHDAMPVLDQIEDTWHPDPRALVHFTPGSHRFEIHPGDLINPLSTVRGVASLAMAIDGPLGERLGFGLLDLVDATLHYVDDRVKRLRPLWAKDSYPRDQGEDEDLEEKLARIREAECFLSPEEEAFGLAAETSGRPWLDRCHSPERAALAWVWATTDSDELEPTIGVDQAVFGGALAVRGRGGEYPVPAAIAFGALSRASVILAREIDDLPVHFLVSTRAAEQAFALLGKPLDAPPDDESPEAAWARITTMPAMSAVPARRRAFVFGSAGGTSTASLEASIERAEQNLSQIGVDEIRSHGAVFDDSGAIHRIVVYGGPFTIRPSPTAGVIHIHVDQLSDIIREVQEGDTARVPTGFLLWQFLEDLALRPRVGQLLAFDTDDVWRHWMTYGTLNPTGRFEDELPIDGVPDDRHWWRAAAWEPFDAILDAAGLPPSWTWQFARLDDRSDEAILTEEKTQYTVVLEPPLVVISCIEPELSVLRIDPTFSLGIADGIRLTVARSEAITSGFRCTDGGPLAMVVRVSASSIVDEPGESDTGIEVVPRDGPRPNLFVHLTRPWLDLLLKDPESAHRQLGQELLRALEALQVTSIDPVAFADEWNATPPVGQLRAFTASLLPRQIGATRPIPRTHATRTRARVRISEQLVDQGVEPTRLSGPEAIALCTDVLLPAVTAAMDSVLATWSPAAIDVVGSAVNDTYAERLRLNAELEGALSAPWADRWREWMLGQEEEVHQTKPADLLLECLLAFAPQGAIVPDDFDVAEAIDLADEIMELSTAAGGARAGLHDLAVEINADGLFRLSSGPADPQKRALAFHVPAYQYAVRLEWLNTRSLTGEPDDPSEWLERAERGEHTPAEYVSLGELGAPGSFLNADRLLLETTGTGLNAISSVFATTVSWNRDDDGVFVVERADLVKSAAAWSRLPASQIESAIDHLLLTRDAIPLTSGEIFDDRRDRPRIVGKPLIKHDGKVLVMPWRVRAAQEFYAASLRDGRLPWPLDAQTEKVRKAFLEYRKRPNRELESMAEEVARGTGLTTRARLEPHEAQSLGLPVRGELDLLAVDVERHRVWVIEVKDPSPGWSPAAMAYRMRRFVDKGNYVDKLLEAEHSVREHLDATLDLLGVPPGPEPWEVAPLMVTRAVETAAFVPEPKVPFVTISNLPEVLALDDPPEPGYWFPAFPTEGDLR